MAQTTLDQRMLGVGTALTAHTITASDVITFADVGDSNLTKKDTLQGVLDLAGGAWEYVDSTNITAVSNIAWTDMASGYDYLYEVTNCDIASDSQGIYFELGVAGPTYRTSGYHIMVCGLRGPSSSSSTTAASLTDKGNVLYTGEGTQSDEHLFFAEIILLDPANASTKTTVYSHNMYKNYQAYACADFSAGLYDNAAEAHTSVKIYPGSGNFDSGGTIRRYRRTRS